MQEIIPSRLAKLRTERKLSQEELAKQLFEFTNGTLPVSTLSISSYERGWRNPPLGTVKMMAQFFNTSTDFLLGLSDAPRTNKKSDDDEEKETKENMEDDAIAPEPGQIIKTNDLYMYNGLPVYIVSNTGEYKNQWAIVNYQKRLLICAGEAYKIGPNFSYYSYPPKESLYATSNRHMPLTYERLLKSKVVWVEMLTVDEYIKGRYNGWYKHNEDNSALVSPSKGYALSYEGCGISYNAYKMD